MSEWSKKTKIIILMIVLALFVPIGMLSPSGMKYFVDKAKAQDRDKDAPARLWFLIRVYYWTQRWEGGEPGYNGYDLSKWWVNRYGGETTEEGRYVSWEPPQFTTDNPRPSYYSPDPHPLTPQVIALMADEIDTTSVFHDRAEHLYKIIKAHFGADSDASHRADEGLLRQQKRVLK
ncbi:hypothetical protein HY251_00160 [bacterium]|nr:hypothetical protein [bacterium]